MKLRTILLLVLSLASVSAFAQPEDSRLRKEFQALYAEMDRAIDRQQASGILRYLDPSYVMVDDQGERWEYGTIREALTQGVQRFRKLTHKSSLKHVQRSGDEVITWVEVVLGMEEHRGNAWVPMKQTERLSETWKRTRSGWKKTYTQQLPTNEPWSFKTIGR